MSDHTAGPWKFEDGSVYGSDECPRSLCLLNEGKENCHLNGLLIAAAPDMLAALKAVYAMTIPSGAEEIIESAIAKAEGGAE